MPGMNMMNHPHPDDQEAAMARADLYKTANYSFKLFKMIQDGDQLEGWVQAKITKAADYVASVFHYLEYEMKFSEYGSKIENSDMYTEAVRKEFKKKLTEAKVKLEKLKEATIFIVNLPTPPSDPTLKYALMNTDWNSSIPNVSGSVNEQSFKFSTSTFEKEVLSITYPSGSSVRPNGRINTLLWHNFNTKKIFCFSKQVFKIFYNILVFFINLFNSWGQ